MMGSGGRDRHRKLGWTPPAVASITLALMATTSPKPVAGQQEDQIAVPGAAAADHIVLRVYGRRKGGADQCGNASFMLQSGPVEVGEMDPSTNCTSETTVFSTRHAPLTAATSWSSGQDDRTLSMGPPLREVKLDVYMVTTRKSAETWARHDVTRAKTVYAKNRVGLTFTADFLAATSLSQADTATIGTGCDHADDIKGSSSVYKADRINVYFVPSIDVPGEPDRTPRGFNCYKKEPGNTDGAPNIIYISTGLHSQNTLAHELGHAFGLQGITGHTGDGVSAWVPGFEDNNLMWTGVSGNAQRSKNHFSLGQVFRMNADERSWLNRNGAPAGAPTPRACHPTRADDQTSRAKDEEPCPPLAFDIPDQEVQ
jgi:hypothetical protein